MLIYFVLLVAILIIPLIIKKNKQQSLIISCLIFLILALRKDTVGKDLKEYLDVFHIVSYMKFIDLVDYNMEIGYLFFNKIISLFFVNNRFFIIIYSLIFTILIKKIIYKNSKIIWLSYFLFISLGFYTLSFNQIRQFFSMIILLLSLEYIKKRNLKKFLIYYFIAISFHYTAISFILLYIIYPVKIDYNYYLFSILLQLFNILYLNKFIYIIIKFFPKYYNRYQSIMISGEGEKLLIFISLIFMINFLLNKKNLHIKENKLFSHMLNLAIFFQTVSLQFSLFSRLTSYFSISLIIIIPNLIFNRNLRKLEIIITVLIGIIFYKVMLYNDLSEIIPYKFFWE